MAHEWDRDLDLQLALAIRDHWGSDVWRADDLRLLAWASIFHSAAWPQGFGPTHLKNRWQENFRKWVPREVPKRASVVNFSVLLDRISTRTYTKKNSPLPGSGTLAFHLDRPTPKVKRMSVVHHQFTSESAYVPPPPDQDMVAPVALPADYHIADPSLSSAFLDNVRLDSPHSFNSR